MAACFSPFSRTLVTEQNIVAFLLFLSPNYKKTMSTWRACKPFHHQLPVFQLKVKQACNTGGRFSGQTEYAIGTYIFLSSTFFYGKLIYDGENVKAKMAASFDKPNREEGMHKRKIKLSKQFFCQFEQQPQGMSSFYGKFWHCFYDLRGDIFVIIWSTPAKETAETSSQ